MRERLVVALSAIALLCTPAMASASPVSRPQIIGGSPTSIEQSPWQVLIVMRNSTQCSGSLVSSTAIVTAAHCLNGYAAADIRVWAGISRTGDRLPAMELPVGAIAAHPAFDSHTFDNDIGLITLSRPTDLTGRLQTLALPFGQDAQLWPASGMPAVISGWGVTSTIGSAPTDQLMRADILVLAGPSDPCGQYGPDVDPVQDVCAGSPTGAIDACQGDSGGPLVVATPVPTLAGIVSFGAECAKAGYPGLYTRMTTFLPWLQSKADLPTTAPPRASGVVVRSSQGRVDVAWTAPAGAGSGTTKWTVTAQPGAQSCITMATTCAFEGLTSGQEVSFTVQGRNAFGPGPTTDASLPVEVVGGRSMVGDRVGIVTLAIWAGVAPDSVTRVLARTGRICAVAGARIRMKAVGTCVIQLNQGRKLRTFSVRVMPSAGAPIR